MTAEKFEEMRRRIDEMRERCALASGVVDGKDEGVRSGG
jgi:phage shock protein A